MISLDDLQKPATAAFALAATAAIGFAAGYIVGRDPELARRALRTTAGGLTRLQVAAADAWETFGDLWADARAAARQEVEAERFAAAADDGTEEATVAPASADRAAPGAEAASGAAASVATARRRSARRNGVAGSTRRRKGGEARARGKPARNATAAARVAAAR